MRRKRKFTRVIQPDPKYGNVSVAKFINHVMRKGKKSTAQKVFYAAVAIIEKKHNQDPMNVFDTAIRNVSPLLEVKSRRIGGATYQVPVEVPMDRQITMAMRWICDAAGGRKGVGMKDSLAAEILEAYQGQGTSVRKREETHKMAQANKAFAHFRW